VRLPHLSDLGPLSVLTNPVRRRLYHYVVRSGRALGRDEAANAGGIQRSLAAYHLDKLAKSGLLEVSYGRAGRATGRPAKLYRAADREFVLRVPPRDYRGLAELLAQAVDQEGGAPLREAVARLAREHGRRVGKPLRQDTQGLDALELLRLQGYEPFEVEHGSYRLRNCPFEAVAMDHPELVCGLNVGLVQGLLEGLGAPEQASLAPAPGVCCVLVGREKTRFAPQTPGHL
jgi:predicted ArsR family transcriptional regulator